MGTKYHGKSAITTVAGVVYAFDETEYEMEDDDVVTTNQTSGGYEELISGNRRGTFTMSGPHDTGSMPLSIGTFYSLKFTVGGSGINEVSFTVTCKISRIKVRTKASGKDPAGVTVTAKSSGAFTPSIT